MTHPAPIAFFVYDRPRHTAESIRYLQQNDLANQSDLHIFSDGPRTPADRRNVEEVRDSLRSIDGFRSVHICERTENLGLAESIIRGVSELLDHSQRVIVLEDDIITAPCTLRFLNQGLEFYRNHQQVFEISAYSRPDLNPSFRQPGDVYCLPRACSWGWATWTRAWRWADWELADFDGFLADREAQRRFAKGGQDLLDLLLREMNRPVKDRAWGVRWCFTLFRFGGLSIRPAVSTVDNIGMDGSGVHSWRYPPPSADLERVPANRTWHFEAEPQIDPEVLARFQRLVFPSLRRRVVRRLRWSFERLASSERDRSHQLDLSATEGTR